MKRLGFIGVAGYVAIRHLAAMKSLGCDLVMAHDLSDSVGVIDSYFPDAYFTTDYETFVKAIEKSVDYLAVCTPNHLHYKHSMMGWRAGADVICEKPLALNGEELFIMREAEIQSGHRVYPILQLRLHPEIVRLKQLVDIQSSDCIHDVELTYVVPRGKWYAESWKGDLSRSGGLILNIGVHFIDMLLWVFGSMDNFYVHHSASDCIAGVMLLKRARVKFFLSINRTYAADQSSCRRLDIDGEKFDFSNGFSNLHTLCYERVFQGDGFSIADAAPAIETASMIQKESVSALTGDCHPFVRFVF